ncbi:MAG: AAA family ATPase [Chakrabartia sp.]
MFKRNKHQPKSIGDLVIPNPKTRQRLEEYANGVRTGHMIMHGPKGTGKTSAANIISEKHEAQNDNSVMQMGDFPSYEGAKMTEKDINGLSQEWHWRRLCGMQPPTIVINEVDKMSPQLLEKLKAEMDQYEERGFGECQVVATTNNLHKLPAALADRFDKIEMPAIEPGDFEDRVRAILAEEEIQISDKELKNILATTNGSFRDALSAIEDIIIKKRKPKP